MLFAIKIDPRYQKISYEITLLCEAARFPKERIPSGDQKTISLALFHAYLADLADCENECFPFSWLIFACICSLI
uniref:Uncharacterized protein n=1 Tax=Geospiza parvula TaxID=87175 RepID=A0A8C3M476_GEOPR